MDRITVEEAHWRLLAPMYYFIHIEDGCIQDMQRSRDEIMAIIGEMAAKNTLRRETMQEAEVSLSVALYYITKGLTKADVRVSLDGAHIKTGDTIHFDIYRFLSSYNCRKVSGAVDSWQGMYEVDGYPQRVIISSIPGIGDVNIVTADGMHFYVESKKGKEKEV